MHNSKGFNHHPTETGIWFPYNNWRFKDYYDVELTDGTIVKNCYPNGDSWQPHENTLGYHIFDKDVVKVRLLPDSELHEWAFTGLHRIERNCLMFGLPLDVESFDRQV